MSENTLLPLIEVRPIENDRWHGKHGKENFARPRTIEVLYDVQTGGYATGLTDEETETLSKELGVDLSTTFNPEQAHPFWASKAAQISLPNNTIFFDPNKKREYIKIQNMRASRFVANSMEELEEGKWPDATHVIYDEIAQVAAKAGKIQLKNKAISMAVSMSADEKVNIIQILSNKSLKGRSQNFLDVEIDTLIADNPEEFVRWASLDPKDVYMNALVLEVVHKNIITKEGAGYYYMGDKIADGMSGMLEWFADPQNSKLKGAILAKVDRKK